MVSAGYVGKATITIKTSGNIYYKASSKKITVTVKDPVREQDRVQAVPQAWQQFGKGVPAMQWHRNLPHLQWIRRPLLWKSSQMVGMPELRRENNLPLLRWRRNQR